jgi:uncharacterized protein
MLQLGPGETAFLTPSKNIDALKWQKEEAGKNSVQVHFTGQEALFSGTAGKAIDLLKVKDHKANLENGLIVRASFLNEKNLKVWLYNPNRESRKKFKGLKFYPFSEKGVAQAAFQKLQTPESVPYVDSREQKGTMYKIGKVSFAFEGKTLELDSYSYESSWDKIQSALIFIRDKTSGKTTYNGGRVVEFEVPKDKDSAEVVLNFNKAFAFLCVHSKFFNCPLGLATYVDANLNYGERL